MSAVGARIVDRDDFERRDLAAPQHAVDAAARLLQALVDGNDDVDHSLPPGAQPARPVQAPARTRPRPSRLNTVLALARNALPPLGDSIRRKRRSAIGSETRVPMRAGFGARRAPPSAKSSG